MHPARGGPDVPSETTGLSICSYGLTSCYGQGVSSSCFCLIFSGESMWSFGVGGCVLGCHPWFSRKWRTQYQKCITWGPDLPQNIDTHAQTCMRDTGSSMANANQASALYGDTWWQYTVNPHTWKGFQTFLDLEESWLKVGLGSKSPRPYRGNVLFFYFDFI